MVIQRDALNTVAHLGERIKKTLGLRNASQCMHLGRVLRIE